MEGVTGVVAVWQVAGADAWLVGRLGAGKQVDQAASGLDDGQMNGRVRNKGPHSPREPRRSVRGERESGKTCAANDVGLRVLDATAASLEIAGKSGSRCWTEARSGSKWVAGQVSTSNKAAITLQFPTSVFRCCHISLQKRGLRRAHSSTWQPSLHSSASNNTRLSIKVP
jgi:hypothetical protein